MPLEQVRNRAQKGLAAEKAKERLVKAGVELFDRYSFDGVSTRMLADRAKVNLASIQYYFGSKEGLYLAVARHIVRRVRSWTAPQIAEIERILSEGKPGKETCFRLLCGLMDEILTHILNDEESKRWMGIFSREQIDPTGAFDILYTGIMEPIHGCLRRLMAGPFDLSPDGQEVNLRAFAIIGPAFMFHVARAEIGRSMSWNGYSPEAHEAIRRVVLDHVRAVLGLPQELLQAYLESAIT
jgi:TetR/AcrR family transcriptional regulator, regulator of cefoperazone and chloramphenicol sensitivity